MVDVPDRGAPANVRGWLSEVYLPALVASQTEQLLRRLGPRATVDDPLFGRASGLEALSRALADAAAWLGERASTFDAVAFTTGSDRDVTEGTLSLTIDGVRRALPIAVVAERRPEREVVVRVYHSTADLGRLAPARAELVPRDQGLALPPPVAAHVHALARGDVDAIVATFENGAAVRDGAGRSHVKEGADGGPLRAYYEGLLGRSAGASRRVVGGIELVAGARADDGRTCALEGTRTWREETGEKSRATLTVYDRGASGLLHALRCYDDA